PRSSIPGRSKNDAPKFCKFLLTKEEPVSNAKPKSKSPSALDFKSATLYALRVVLRSHDDAELLAALSQRMNDAGAFFENEPVVIDANLITETIDWAALLQALRGHSLHPVGVVAQRANLDAALAQGLAAVDLGSPTPRPTAQPAPEQEVPVVAPPPATQGNDTKAEAAEQTSPP